MKTEQLFGPVKVTATFEKRAPDLFRRGARFPDRGHDEVIQNQSNPGFLYDTFLKFAPMKNSLSEIQVLLTDKNAWTTSALTVLKGFSLVTIKKG